MKDSNPDFLNPPAGHKEGKVTLRFKKDKFGTEQMFCATGRTVIFQLNPVSFSMTTEYDIGEYASSTLNPVHTYAFRADSPGLAPDKKKDLTPAQLVILRKHWESEKITLEEKAAKTSNSELQKYLFAAIELVDKCLEAQMTSPMGQGRLVKM